MRQPQRQAGPRDLTAGGLPLLYTSHQTIFSPGDGLPSSIYPSFMWNFFSGLSSQEEPLHPFMKIEWSHSAKPQPNAFKELAG